MTAYSRPAYKNHSREDVLHTGESSVKSNTRVPKSPGALNLVRIWSTNHTAVQARPGPRRFRGPEPRFSGPRSVSTQATWRLERVRRGGSGDVVVRTRPRALAGGEDAQATKCGGTKREINRPHVRLSR